jgi:hypothetical protein
VPLAVSRAGQGRLFALYLFLMSMYHEGAKRFKIKDACPVIWVGAAGFGHLHLLQVQVYAAKSKKLHHEIVIEKWMYFLSQF